MAAPVDAALRVRRRERERGCVEIGDVQERDIEPRVEEHHDGRFRAGLGQNANRACPGHDVRVRDDIAVGHHEPAAGQRVGARLAVDLDRAGNGRFGDRPDGRIRGQCHRRPGDPLEADEHLRQPRGIEPSAELAGDLGGWRQQLGEGPDRHGTLRLRRQGRHRTGGQQAPDQPDDEQPLGNAEERAAARVDLAEHAPPESKADLEPDRGADRLAERDAQDQSRQHDDGAEPRIELVELGPDDRQNLDRGQAACRGADQAGELRCESGTPSGHEGQDEEQDRNHVKGVHGQPGCRWRELTSAAADGPDPRVDTGRMPRLPRLDLRHAGLEIPELVGPGQDHQLHERIDVELEVLVARAGGCAASRDRR